MTPDKTKDEAAVKALVDSFFSYMGSNDFDNFISLVADDIILLPPNTHSLYGKEAMKELIQPWFETLDMSHEILETEIVTDNNIAYARIEYRDSFSSKEGGETILMHNKALWIFRREAEDTWKIIRNMWNRNPPGTEHHLKFNPFWVK